MKKKILSSVAMLLFWTASFSFAADVKPVEVKKEDKCPVCGMFVAKYKTWIAQVIFSDGSYAAFDGPKDMLKYHLNLNKYAHSRKPSDIAAVYVTEYYSAKLMDAKKMLYVIGSDVNGPMGDELVPIASEEKAKEFLRDHKGNSILKFSEITHDHLLRSYER
jgi:nitrous oxide reductase accessory protein NosL